MLKALEKKIRSKITHLKNHKILVIGDIMLDEFHWCEVNRISPEAPVPVCEVKKTTLAPGGAANVANNIQCLSNTAILIGLIGEDSSGEKLKQCIASQQISTDALIQNNLKPTTLKSRIIAHQQQVTRVDREISAPIDRKTQNQLFSLVQTHIKEADALLISDYLKGTLTTPLLKQLISEAKKRKLPIIVDPKGDDYKKYNGATILTPNFKEFEGICNKKIRSEDMLEKEAQRVIQKCELSALVITRSEKGMSIIAKNKPKMDITTQAQEVYDITGAGDTVIAVLTIALSAGLPLEEAVLCANYAAGIVVGKLGTASITLDELHRRVMHLSETA